MSLKKTSLFLVGLLIALVALVAAGCGGSGGGGAPEALPSSSCTAIEYEGDGNPDYLLVSDLPLQGASRTQTLQINDAIRYELKKANYKAGDYNIGFQSCDDATAQAGKWDSGKCSQNANAYAANDKVIGIIGTFNSGCAGIIIPVVNQAPNGGIAMLSPANTYVCLTQGGPGLRQDRAGQVLPVGHAQLRPRRRERRATRVPPTPSSRSRIGVKNVYILNDKEAYGLGVATNFENAAKSLGIKIAGFDAFDPKASSYEALFNKIKATGADAVFIGGLICENGAQLIKDKVAVLGAERRRRQAAHAGRLRDAADDRRRRLGFRRHVHVGRRPADRQVPGRGQDVRDELLQGVPERQDDRPVRHLRRPGGTRSCSNAIGASDGSRSDVISKMFASEVQNGLLGSFKFSANGDPEGGERSGRRHHGLQGDGQARDRQR